MSVIPRWFRQDSRIRRPLSFALQLAVFFGSLAASSATAGEGVVEINQVCATQTGCDPLDPPGFPVTLTGAGSYQLTTDLKLASANTDAIELAGDGIHVDLNGFTIRGVTRCSGVPLSCTGAGSGRGITSTALGGASQARVRGGSIIGMGAEGVFLGSGAHVSHLTVTSNGSTGIRVGPGSLVTGNTVTRNLLEGVLGVGGAQGITANVLRENGSNGIRTDHGVVIGRNRVASERQDGCDVGYGSVVIQNVFDGSYRGTNIQGSDGTAVHGNIARGGTHGIVLPNNSIFSHNTVTGTITTPVPLSPLNGGGNVCTGIDDGGGFCL